MPQHKGETRKQYLSRVLQEQTHAFATNAPRTAVQLRDLMSIIQPLIDQAKD